ncbi:RNA-binding protein [Pleomorphomonas diazotrophica]|uniref:RNA-binding protein n=1 Tax=Pleomorphomonas diazotrophica TaxID=1166257 RepID=A0A1I4WP62_9HYPH|nr:DUF4159 domain-containing protein [Pleomorphomonas diazotrophica]PKR87300.1 RNA-binding protein [Pleomorphomonas diazotrophica]SFN15601.1 N-terminal double-transmembrane domain-containing protein [Pleomorphomonas diazotrophica]
MSALSFAAPLALLGLLALPAIWWLLKATPPRPVTRLFPPLALIIRPKRDQETPVRTPWWLIALRLLIAGLIVLAVAGPILQPAERIVRGDGPLWLVIDNGASAAPDWPERRATAAAVLAEAGDAGRPVLLVATADGPDGIGSQTTAAEALRRVNALAPRAILPDRAPLLPALTLLAATTPPGEIVVLPEPGDNGTAHDFLSGLASLSGSAPVTLAISSQPAPVAMDAVEQDGAAVTVHLRRPDAGAPAEGGLRLLDRKGRLLDERPFALTAGNARGDVRFELPLEIRNDIARAEVTGGNSALGVHLLDDRWRRRSVAIVTATGSEAVRPLIAPEYFLEKALAPFAEVTTTGQGALSDAFKTAVEGRPAAILVADVGRLGESEAALARAFMEKGGVLIRFAGPRLAASDEIEVPAPLRRGDRALGGSLSWSKPQVLGSFSDNGPYAGLAVPGDVTVNRQVLAEPGVDLADRTWASLSDGTPLVTAARVGAGWLVLFHVTADTRWSNLPISGVFVEMLRRTVALGAAEAGVREVGGNTTLPPLSLLDGYGRASAPAAGVTGIREANMAAIRPSRSTPPGLYGSDDGFRALNPLKPDMTYAPPDLSGLPDGVRRTGLVTETAIDLSPFGFGLAFLLLLADGLAVTALAGGFRRRHPVTAAVTIGLILLVTRPDAHAADDARLLEALSATRLAYVETGVTEVDETSRAGLSTLSRFIASHSSLEPGEPMAVDPEHEELSVFPLIYWPIDAAAPMPSAAAMARVEAFMKDGGSVLFDSRDDADFSAASPNTARLRDMLAMIDVPPLEPVPSDHVLTKSFYLLGAFVGRTEGSPLWIEAPGDDEREDTGEARPVRAADGVSPLLITGNDLAGAWAADDGGAFLHPLVPDAPRQREFAFRAGVNIVIYVLTGSYKADQVHVPALLERLGE